MQSFRKTSPSPPPVPSLTLPVGMELAISLCALPMIGMLLSEKAVSKGLMQLGEASEEIFRGDRLPILPLLNSDQSQAQHDAVQPQLGLCIAGDRPVQST